MRTTVDAGALQMVINVLRRDAADGKTVRGEMADALLATADAIELDREIEARKKAQVECEELKERLAQYTAKERADALRAAALGANQIWHGDDSTDD